MKTLATCNPIEFMVQTNRIRKAVWDWLQLTKIMDMRKKLPEAKEGASKEEMRAALEAQIKINAGAMLDSILGEHPKETAEVLGLMCFIEPEDLVNHEMRELFGAFGELMGTPEVIDFFISLTRWDQTTTGDTVRA